MLAQASALGYIRLCPASEQNTTNFITVMLRLRAFEIAHCLIVRSDRGRKVAQHVTLLPCDIYDY